MGYYDRLTILTDPETGEVISEISDSVVVPDYADEKTNARATKREVRMRSIEQFKQYGPFVWLKYDLCQPLCPELLPADVCRILLLGSMKGDCRRDFVPMELGFNRAQSYKIMHRIAQTQYLDSDRDPGDVQDRLIWVGSVDREKVKEDANRGRYLTRMYKQSYQEVYRSLNGKNHTAFGYLLRLIPFLSRKHNIICAAPLEQYIEKISPLTCNGIADVLGLQRQHVYAVKNILLDLKITVGLMQQSVFKSIPIRGKQGFIVNPRLVYAGQDWFEVEELGRFEADAVKVKIESPASLPVGPG